MPDRRRGAGCSTFVWTVFWTIAFGGTIIFSLTVLEPLTIEALKPAFCTGKVEVERNPRRPSYYCTEKNGKRTNISHIQMFGQCPCAFMMVFLLCALLISNFILGKIERRE